MNAVLAASQPPELSLSSCVSSVSFLLIEWL